MKILLPPLLEGAFRVVKPLLGEAYLVGGAVRDLVLGLSPKDLDFATPLPPEEVARRLGEAGLLVGLAGARFGTVYTVVPVEDVVLDVEVTTFRSEAYAAGRKPRVGWASSLLEDLARRDFTVNAMALGENGVVIDPFGGLEDLRRGLVRAVGDARARFQEDPLRVVRAFRFAARYGWRVEEATLRAARELSFLVGRKVSAPRFAEEVTKGLLAPGAEGFVRGLFELGVWYDFLPELVGPHGPAHLLLQNPLHHPEGDVAAHLAQVAGRARELGADPLGVWAAFLHDIGKPATAQPTPEGWYRFPGHDVLGAEMIPGIARRFGWSRAWEEVLVATTRLHMRVLQPATPRAVRRFQAEAGSHLSLLRLVCTADGEGRREDLEAWFRVESPVEPLLLGRDLLALGLKPGPELGRLLRRAYELQLELGLKTKEEVLEALGLAAPA